MLNVTWAVLHSGRGCCRDTAAGCVNCWDHMPVQRLCPLPLYPESPLQVGCWPRSPHGLPSNPAELCTLMLNKEQFIRCGEGFGSPFTFRVLFLLWNLLGFASQCSNFCSLSLQFEAVCAVQPTVLCVSLQKIPLHLILLGPELICQENIQSGVSRH